MQVDLDKSIAIGKILMERKSEGPEFIRPSFLDDYQYRCWLTIIVALDYLKDADQLWSAGRQLAEDSGGAFFNFEFLRNSEMEEIVDILRTWHLSIYYNKDAKYLKKIAEIMKKYDDDPLNIIKENGYDGELVIDALQEFPLLRGKKLAPFWLRIMHDLVEPKLDIFHIDIPVDVHIARLTTRTGCVKMDYDKITEEVRQNVRNCWAFTAIVLDTYPGKFDEPLWSISKYICPNCPEGCPIESYCDDSPKNVGL